MPPLAAVEVDGQLQDATKIARPIKDAINQARTHRKPMEAIWQSNMSYAAGQVWLVLDKNRQLRKIQDLDSRYRRRELYNADVITEYRMTVLGELGSDDDRPELLLQRDDLASEDFQGAANRAVGFAWDHEAHADEALAEVDRLTVDLGTAAMRCRFDASVGPIKADAVPHLNGKPVFGDQAIQAVANAAQNGSTLDYQPIRQGKITLEPLSAFNLLPPAGVTHERYFPFDCVVRPTRLAEVQARWPEATSDLKEDRDISSTLGEASVGTGVNANASKDATLRGHVWLFTYYERPTPMNPKGRVFHFAGNQLRLLGIDPELPYRAPDGTYRSGVTYFHFWRVTGRFWSRSMIEPMKDPARSISKRRMQQNEIIDRGLPWVGVQKGSEARKRTDLPLEMIEFGPSEQAPVVVPGLNPGQWMNENIEQMREDIEHGTGVKGPALGENPAAVTTYSQLSLIKEGDQTKRQPTMIERKLAIAQMTENIVYDMRTYWGDERQIMLAGDDDEVQAETFNATKIPSFFIIKIAKGSAKPRTQGAEIQKIADIWNAVIASGAATLAPTRWIAWLKESYDAGQVLALPDDPTDDQVEKAGRENHLMLAGAEVPIAYYDPVQVHIPIHRKAQIEAEYAGDVGAWQRIESHVKEHEAAAQEQAQQVAQIQAQGIAQLPPGPQGQPGQPQGQPGQGQPQTAGAGAGEPNPSSAVPSMTMPMSVNVPPPEISVNVPEQQQPNVVFSPNVAAPPPMVSVEPSLKVGDREITFERDEQGRITGAKVKEAKRKRG